MRKKIIYFLRIYRDKFLRSFFKKRIFRPSEIIFSELEKTPRYTKTSVSLFGKILTIPDGASFLFMHREIFQQEIYKFETLNKRPFIIDGGANIGLSIIFFKKLFPASKIIAFEPDPNIFKIMEDNINHFNFENLKLIQKGLWNRNCTLSFKTEGADGGVLSSISRNTYPSVQIEVVSLKPYLQETVDFLKLDIEGAETIVLRDIELELKNVKRIFVEYHSFVGQPQSLNEVLDILTRSGFRLYVSSPGISSKNPFIKLNVYNNMDMQLNIYGYKE